MRRPPPSKGGDVIHQCPPADSWLLRSIFVPSGPIPAFAVNSIFFFGGYVALPELLQKVHGVPAASSCRAISIDHSAYALPAALWSLNSFSICGERKSYAPLCVSFNRCLRHRHRHRQSTFCRPYAKNEQQCVTVIAASWCEHTRCPFPSFKTKRDANINSRTRAYSYGRG